MKEPSEHLQKIKNAVARLARRVRFQRLIESLTTAITLQLMVLALLVVLVKTGWLETSALLPGLGITFILPVVLGAWAWFKPLNFVELARRLDVSHNLHDRLSTALSMGDATTEFAAAQLRDAASFIEGLEVGKAAPFQRPTDFAPFVVAISVVGLLLALKAPEHKRELPEPFVVSHSEILDSATIALEKERLEVIKKELEKFDDPESKELVEEMEKLLIDVENRTISRKEFLERLDKLEKKFFDKQPDPLEALAEELKKAAETLEKEAKKDLEASPEAKKLVDALKQKDLAKAAEAAAELAKKLEKDEMSAKELERLASVLEKFSELIDPDDPKLQKLIEQNRDLINKMQDLFDKNKLSDKEKKRLQDLKKDTDEMEKRGNAKKGKMTSRELKSLSRQTEQMAKQAKDAANQKKENAKSKKPNEEGQKKESDFRQEASRKAEEMKEALEQGANEQQKDDAKRMAQEQLEELREAMQRQGQKDDSQTDSRGEQMKEFLERAKGEGKEDGTDQASGDAKTDGVGKAREKEGGADKSDAKGSGRETAGSDSANLGEGQRELGEETSMDSKKKDENLSGRDAKGASKSEIIKAASEEGFANTQYKDVFVDYEAVVEEVMEKEKVPPGYRFYVKRYFQLIKPQE